MKQNIQFANRETVENEGLGVVKFAWLYVLSYVVILVVLSMIINFVAELFAFQDNSVLAMIATLISCQAAAYFVVIRFKKCRQRRLTEGEFISLRKLSGIISASIISLFCLLLLLSIWFLSLIQADATHQSMTSNALLIIGLLLFTWGMQWLFTRLGYQVAIKSYAPINRAK